MTGAMTADEPRPFLVLCRRHDGTERTFNRYAMRERAESVARALCDVGCAARATVGPDDIELEPHNDRGDAAMSASFTPEQQAVYDAVFAQQKEYGFSDEAARLSALNEVDGFQPLKDRPRRANGVDNARDHDDDHHREDDDDDPIVGQAGPRRWTKRRSTVSPGTSWEMIEPNTESDRVALLLQTLVAFGALVGRGPHYKVEGDEHHANLYVVAVGNTSKGRKGTSLGRVREIFEPVPEWKPHVSGLSTGEGLKYHVRDERTETKPNKHGEIVTEVIDTGVTESGCSYSSPSLPACCESASVTAIRYPRRCARPGRAATCERSPRTIRSSRPART